MCKSLKNWLTGYLLLICIIFLLAFISTGVAIYEYLRVVDGGLFPNSPVRSDWGVTGDFFGGVLNPILAFCSLIALLYTVHLNKQELEATRKELATTRATMNEQMEVSKQQRFESTFFSFLDQHNQVLKEISQDGENIHSLADSRKFSAFQVYDYLFRDGVKTTSMKHIKYTQIVVKKARDELKVGFSQINRYFHVLFQLLKLVNSSTKCNAVKKHGRRNKAKPFARSIVQFVHNCIQEIRIDVRHRSLFGNVLANKTIGVFI